MKTLLSQCLPFVLVCFLLGGQITGAEESGSTGKDNRFDWPCWMGPDRNGISRETALNFQWDKAGPIKLWQVEVGTGFSCIVVANNRLYTMGNKDDQDTLFCLNAETGDEIWKHTYASPLNPNYYMGGPGSSPTVHGKWVYCLSKTGHLFCLDAATGKGKWEKQIHEEFGYQVPGWGFSGSPYIDGDTLLLNAGSAGLALNKNDGALVWKSPPGMAGYATPVLFPYRGKKTAAFFTEKTLEIVDFTTGKNLISYEWATSHGVNAADPIFRDEKIFISSGYGKGCTLVDISSGKGVEIYKSKAMKNMFSSCLYLDGYLYGISGQSGNKAPLKCMHFETGKVQWAEKKFKVGSLISAGGKLIVLDGEGDLVIVDPNPKEYKEEARAKILEGTCWTMPVLANSRLFARTGEGDLVCVDLGQDRKEAVAK